MKRELKAKTHLAHLKSKDVAMYSISKASISVRCCKTGFAFTLHPRFHNSACLRKYINNVNMVLTNLTKVRNYYIESKNFGCWLTRDNKTNFCRFQNCRFTIELNSS